MSLLDIAPVVPVVVIDDLETAVPLARALVSGGLPVIEVTLRTPVALEAIRRIAAEVPEAVIGAGTVRTARDVAASVEAGSKFLVSPGSTAALVDAMEDGGVPFLAGVATASEVMALAERGLTEMKFFPAEAAGGLPYLKSLGGPLPDVRFCPTGGIRLATAPDYLALPNVGCVGGTWLTPADALASGDYARIEKLAAEAAALRPAA
ncbi:bifunctional 4-hydroxy-2-oxoglutarate aldolase/2-dehydro-3-deoxy-phosphogluconate aldolase [Planomonospora parontospora]|uniref:bifunctional 4-hydroxy-2-oxoglutarate aldolase/2-dehydro-3-deoxy-phosphogluconate aldolase n=1 Tax=Planomonospora parontospora TaxID=58119 RepID=UPI00166FF5E6|nr:bifunctional 4-hydroxy-2-oxoglutarate aldolase/2-dehydro-3-deoxy-phosphogluconate aldolase [Planomonospora parontospora]GGL55766.1 ketohydroxyglutarate aldolase [Planomonospora parontospora subsp. antibiotica]GII19826.1 ketohydroxyglutarate aldolase [Planomonospora parontospora subsp. antibiotica]